MACSTFKFESCYFLAGQGLVCSYRTPIGLGLAMAGIATNTMVVHPSVPVKTMAELGSYLKATPASSAMPPGALAEHTI